MDVHGKALLQLLDGQNDKSYHFGKAGIDSQLKTRKITTETFAVFGLAAISSFLSSSIISTQKPNNKYILDFLESFE